MKSETRLKRGTGIRRRVASDVCLPKNWKDFLRLDDNKAELFRFLTKTLRDSEIPGKQILATSDENVLSCPTRNVEFLAPCTHKEEDTRMILHAKDAAQTAKNIMIRTVDTDVVAIAMAYFQDLTVDSLWIGFGTGKHFHYIAVHELANTIGPDKSR